MSNEISAEYMKAVDLDRRIKVSIQLAQQNLYDMCMSFKEMRDSGLHKELGYGEFDDYCKKEVGFSDRQVYKYISIVENLPQDLVKSTSLIGTEKLYFLSRLDEPQREELQQTTDLESVSVRELKKQIEELKIKADKADMLGNRLDDMNQICTRISGQRDKAESKIRQLEDTIEELEKRPIEVAVSESDSHEIQNLKDAMKRVDLDWSQKYNELQEETTKETIANNQKHAAELEQLKAEYEEKLSEAEKSSPGEPVPDTKEVFKAYLSNAVDSANRLLGFVQLHPDEEIFIAKTKEFFNAIIAKMEV